MIKLDLGGAIQSNCDDNSYLTVDLSPNAGLVMNLDDPNFKFPFGDDTVDEIRAFHILEHIHNIYPLLDECHRVLKAGGFMYIVVPKFPEGCATVDPTHVRFMTPENFHYFSRKFAYMNYTKNFWYMNLDEAMRFNSSMRDVCFRIEMSPDKRDQHDVKTAVEVLKHYVVEQMGEMLPTDAAVDAMAILTLHNAGELVRRYKLDREECGFLDGQPIDYYKLGLIDDELKRAAKDYGPARVQFNDDGLDVVSMETDLKEGSTLVIENVDYPHATDTINTPEVPPTPDVKSLDDEYTIGCALCGTMDDTLMVVSGLDENIKHKILDIYPTIPEGTVCNGCIKTFS